MNKGVPLMLLAATVILLWLPLVLPPLSPPPLFLLFVPVVMMLLLFSLVLFPSHHCAYPSPTFTQLITMSGGQVLAVLKLYSLFPVYPYAISLLLLVGIYIYDDMYHTTHSTQEALRRTSVLPFKPR